MYGQCACVPITVIIILRLLIIKKVIGGNETETVITASKEYLGLRFSKIEMECEL